MNIEPFYARRKPTAEVGAARMDYPGYHTGREFAAIAELGQAFGATGELAEKRLNTIVQSEFTAGKADWETAHVLFEEGLRQDPDYGNYLKKYKQYAKKIQKDILTKATTGGAKKALSQMFEQLTPSVNKSIGNLAWSKKQGAMRADLLVAVRKHELAGSAAKAEAALIEGVDAGIIAPDVAAGRVLQIKRNIEWNAAVQLAESDPDALLGVLDDPKHFKNLDKNDKELLRSRARSSQSRLRASDEKETKERQDKTEQTGWDLWRDGRLTHGWIQAEINNLHKSDRDKFTAFLDAEANLEVKRQADLEKIYAAKDKNEAGRLVVKGINAGTMSKFIVGSVAEAYDFSPAEYEGYLKDFQDKQGAIIPYESYAEVTDLLDGVRKGVVDESQVKTKIADFVTEAVSAGLEKEKAIALGIGYREKLSSAIASRDDPDLNTPRAAIYFDLLSDSYRDGEIEPLDYDRKYVQLTNFFKANPDATPEQAAKFYEDLMRGVTDGWIKGLLRGGFEAWKESPFGYPYKKVFPEKSPFPEYPDAFKSGDNWYVTRDGKRYRIEK